tara:strand:+ start:4597 stop:6321 length:1725 start_codon:yes stop_codon:yes gene_type:complete
MLTFNQLQEKKTKIKINPKVQDQYEGKKSDGIELVDEGEKVARGAQKRAEQLGAKRRQASYKKYGANVGSPGKNERAGYNLSRAARSSESSPETQRTKKKRPAGEDTSQIGHSRKAQEKTDTGKSGKKLKTPKYKLTFKQRQQHHSNYAHSRRDPKQNPKHTANTKKESVEYSIEEERSARKMNVRTKGTIKKQIAKDAAAEAKRREKKTGEYAEKPKKRPSLKKPSQLTTVKAEPKKEAPKPKAKPVAKKAAPKPKAKPVAKKPVAKKVAPKKAAPKVDKKAADIDRPKGNLTSKAREWVKKGVKRHRKATQGARVFAKGAAKGAKDTVKFAGKVKKVFTGEEFMSFKAYLLSEDYHRGQGEKIQKRTKKWMEKKGQDGAPGLNAMKARTAEHKAKRGVKSEGYQRDPDRQEKDRKTSKQTDPSKDGFTGIGNSIADIMKQNAAMKKAAAKKTKKEETEIDEATRLKKEKGYDKGGTKKPSGKKDAALSFVLDKIRKEHGKGAIAGQGSKQQKKVKGAKSSAGTGKYLKRAKAKAQTAADAKKRGFKSSQDYVNTMARYGGKDNYDKGRGLGT